MPRPFCVHNTCFSSQSPREYHIIFVIDKFAMENRACSPALLRRDAQKQGLLGMSVETEEEKEYLVKDTERQELLDEIAD